MPRNPEDSAQIRQQRRDHILDAALSVYARCGYTGCDMDMVAAEALLPKGLVYYYFKTKQQLFTTLFNEMLQKGMQQSEACLAALPNSDTIKQLLYYVRGFYSIVEQDPRIVRFFIRLPFDAYAIFGPEQWREGIESSNLHQNALALLIDTGMKNGEIPKGDPVHAANCFWSVFVADLLSFSAMIAGKEKESTPQSQKSSRFEEVIAFCFGGLGIDRQKWQRVLAEENNLL